MVAQCIYYDVAIIVLMRSVIHSHKSQDLKHAQAIPGVRYVTIRMSVVSPDVMLTMFLFRVWERCVPCLTLARCFFPFGLCRPCPGRERGRGTDSHLEKQNGRPPGFGLAVYIQYKQFFTVPGN